MPTLKCKYIEDYISDIQSGTIPASKELVKATHYIQRKLSQSNVWIDIEKIEKAIELIERYFEIVLIDWQLFILSLVHCYYTDKDAVVFDEFLIVMGRGNGKNGFISPLSWYLTTHYHGVKGYNVDIIANSEDQAQTSFHDIYEMLESTWNKSKRFFYKSKTVIRNLITNSYIKYNTSNARTKDGKRSACLIFDELHEYENSDIIGVFSSGFGKRKHSRIFKITTNGNVREGVLDEELRLADDVLNGIVTNLGLCPLIYKLDSEEEADNPELWKKANPSIDAFPELRAQIEKDYIEKEYRAQVEQDFYTKRMNLPRNTSDMAVTSWENIKATYVIELEGDKQTRTIPDLSGHGCVAGIDYTQLNDWASVNLRFKLGDIKYDISHSWMCAQSRDLKRIQAPWQQWAEQGLLTVVDDVEIPPEVIANYLLKAMSKYNILGLSMDGYRYGLLSASLEQIGFSADRKNITLVRPSDIMKIVPSIESDFNNKRLVWGDNPPLRWATNNTKRVRSSRKMGFDTGNFTYAKIEAKSRKTDPFMAVVHSAVIDYRLGSGVAYQPLPVITF